MNQFMIISKQNPYIQSRVLFYYTQSILSDSKNTYTKTGRNLNVFSSTSI